MNQKPSARDLLRRSREQKKQRVKAPLIRSKQSGQTTPSKRSRDDDDKLPSSTVEQRPEHSFNLPAAAAAADENKRPKLVDYSEKASSAHASQPSSSSLQLPAGFFDADVPVLVDDDDDNEESDEVEGEIQQPVEPIQVESEKDEQLLKDLDMFESEIAGLENTAIPEPPLPSRPTDPGQPERGDSVDAIDVQGDEWKARTSRLLHLRSIITEGLQGMDQNETNEEEDYAGQVDIGHSSSDSDDSDDSDFAALTDWRMSKTTD
ncbi:hypothetical protein EV175_000140 [Coemansia sp. RSA 1933]|nr:hypothetical protein EV175_000140 [Coemansia sp. RSA 1933]